MVFTPSVSPGRRADLRRLRAEFDSALAAMGGGMDRGSPAYRAADARYRAWIGALDEVAVALIDDLDAAEAAARGAVHAGGLAPEPPPAADPIDVARLFSGLDDVQRAADLIGTRPVQQAARRRNTPVSRAMGVIGDDRVARHRSLNGGHQG